MRAGAPLTGPAPALLPSGGGVSELLHAGRPPALHRASPIAAHRTSTTARRAPLARRWFSFGNLERAPSEGPEPGSPAATGTTADLRVGDFVKLAEGYAAHSDASSGPMRPGQAGVVVSRGSEGRVPFRVRVKQLGPDGPTGAEWWYDVQAISKVSKAEADEMVAGAASNIYPDLHPHPLRPSEHNASHACDGCNAYPLGQGGARCVSGCDFDLCRACYARGGASSAARPLGRSPSEARRPTVGDFVQLAPGFETLRDAANGPLKPGLVGRVVIDDSTPPTPLRVIYKGHEWYGTPRCCCGSCALHRILRPISLKPV